MQTLQSNYSLNKTATNLAGAARGMPRRACNGSLAALSDTESDTYHLQKETVSNQEITEASRVHKDQGYYSGTWAFQDIIYNYGDKIDQ